MPLVGELEARIDEALVIARASEEGVREVGEIALDAARQARRAAEAAEKSAEAAVEAREVALRPAGPLAAGDPLPPAAPAAGGIVTTPSAAPRAEEKAGLPRPPRFEVRFRSFSERADRVSDRLRRLCEQPPSAGAASVGAARRRGDG
ncbi:MAG TPA: hypothetical protein VFK14_06830 [Solirubrobacterales bacterium]|nr:hypothetical protein [Solirubrobacterales bacterium]